MSKIKPLKYATVEQAIEAYNAGTFVYHNSCSNALCKKQCSTPTKDIWLRRINEFGSIQNMYAQYKCRKCRKGNAVVAAAPASALDVVVVAVEPLRCIAKQPAMMKKKEERPMVQVKPCKPMHEVGKHVMNKPGHFAFSVWEDGVFKGTTYYKHSGKDS